MKLYLSGPISGMPDGNRPAFDKAERELADCGYSVVNPAVHTVEGWTWEQYLKHDLPLMLKCDGVAMLPGWWRSTGAKLEIDVAHRLKMPVRATIAWVNLRVWVK